jgi:hypothetical protein
VWIDVRLVSRLMGLDVIGAGFGRTGTLSLKTALERLGFERCYHMYEVLGNLPSTAWWIAADRGEPVDWEVVFDGYRATVDWPGCAFWRELVEAYPDAPVVLSVRPPERWFASFHETIYQVMLRERPPPSELPPELAQLLEFADRTVRLRSFGEGLADMTRDQIIGAYEAHNAAVVAGVPAERLLVFDVAEGWEPLCRFLEVEVPGEPFPNVNDRDQFKALFGLGDDLREPPTEATMAELEARFRDAASG